MGNSKRTKSLKASLIGHQKRQAENAAAAKKQAALKDKGKSKGRKGPQEKRFIIPLSALDRILLIGEGNFSFAHSLLQHPSLPHLPPSNITATAYDTEDECLSKYPDASAHISSLRNAGATVLFGVDATKLEKTFKKGERWDKVVWNFPHVGMGIADVDRNVVANQKVLLGFLKSVANVLERGVVVELNARRGNKGKEKDKDKIEFSDEDEEEESKGGPVGPKRAGSVLVTLREQEPYTLWLIFPLLLRVFVNQFRTGIFHGSQRTQ
ncbi:25S rRNA (uridine-N(3))-methyltransferase [Ceratobasidium sp. AG-Ba]|nr:25S rRNA (uridine-N(3))-methyltransferase [Ceratobasidium sp. AG-Ba]